MNLRRPSEEFSHVLATMGEYNTERSLESKKWYSPIVANTFIKKTTLTILLVILSSSYDDLEIDL